MTGTLIRPATDADRDAVFRICDNIWPETDHVPWYWSKMLNNPVIMAHVIETDGRVAAFACLELVGNEGWWHSVRVDPAYQRQGFASRLLRHHLAEARQRGFSSLRYAADSENEVMHLFAMKHGFRPLTEHRYVCASRLAEPAIEVWRSACREMDESDFAQVEAFLHASPAWRSGHLTWCRLWAWPSLTASALRSLLAQGTVYGCFSEAGLDAVALMVQEQEQEYNWFFLARIDGSSRGIATLGRYLRGMLPPTGAEDVPFPLQGVVLDDPETIGALAQAGFSVNLEDIMRVYELALPEPP